MIDVKDNPKMNNKDMGRRRFCRFVKENQQIKKKNDYHCEKLKVKQRDMKR